MIKGSVTPPVAYLSAVEILHRQFAAFLVDSLDINAERQPLVNAGDVYDESGGKVSLASLIIARVRDGISDLLALFETTVATHVARERLEELKKWATGEGSDPLIGRLRTAEREWREELHSLVDRRRALRGVLDDRDARINDNDGELAEDQRKAQASTRAVQRQLKNIRRQ